MHVIYASDTGTINQLLVQGEPVEFDYQVAVAQGLQSAGTCTSVNCQNNGML